MYTQILDAIRNAVSTKIIRRDADQAIIPFDSKNADYQAYLVWLSEGNAPSNP